MNHKRLLELYYRDPSAAVHAIEQAARRERARVIGEFFANAAAALFRRLRSVPASGATPGTRAGSRPAACG